MILSPKIVSERLILRPVTLSDAEQVFQLRTDPIVNQWVKRSSPANLKEAEDFIHMCNQQTADNECVYWGIQEIGSEKMIGSLSLWNYSKDRKKAEVGYDLLSEYWNKGYLSELLPLVLKQAFEVHNFTRVEAYTQKQNPASIRLLKKFGFVQDKAQTDPDNPDNLIFSIQS